MLFNRWVDAILNLFGGRDEENGGISAQRYFGAVASARAGASRLLHKNFVHQKKHNLACRERQNDAKSCQSIDEV